MLAELGLPKKKKWFEAINTACHTQKLFMLTKQHGKTPSKLGNNMKSRISYFHIFGCKDLLKVFDSKTVEEIFLEYSIISKTYGSIIVVF